MIMVRVGTKTVTIATTGMRKRMTKKILEVNVTRTLSRAWFANLERSLASVIGVPVVVVRRNSPGACIALSGGRCVPTANAISQLRSVGKPG